MVARQSPKLLVKVQVLVSLPNKYVGVGQSGQPPRFGSENAEVQILPPAPLSITILCL